MSFLTPELEKLIWCNKAELKTWTIGTSSAELEVPRGKTVVIVQIMYFPFLDSGEASLGINPEIWKSRQNKQVTLSSVNRRNTFLFRSYFTAGLGIISGEPTIVSTYLPFYDNINLAIANIPPPSGQTNVTAVAPDMGIKPRPLTYGQFPQANALPVNTGIEYLTAFGLSSEIRPFPATRKDQAGLGINESFTDFEVPYDPLTSYIDANQDAANEGVIQFPLITVQYVLVDENLKTILGG